MFRKIGEKGRGKTPIPAYKVARNQFSEKSKIAFKALATVQ
jgi:hypothetical protein